MSAVLRPLVAIGRSREDSGPLTLWGCFNLCLEFWKYVTNSSLMKVGVYSWLFTVQSLTNIHCICIHRTQWHLSDFIKGYIYISWNSVNYTQQRRSWRGGDFLILIVYMLYVTIFRRFFWQIRRKEVNTVYQFIFRVLKNLWTLTFLFVTVFFCDFEKFLIANNTGYNFC